MPKHVTKSGDEIVYITIRKKINKKIYKKFDLETSPRLFCIYKELSKTSIGK